MPIELEPGLLVRVRAAIDYQPYCTIPVGVTGLIISTTIATVLVSWSATIRGLERWNNVAMLEYYEALASLELVEDMCDPGPVRHPAGGTDHCPQRSSVL